jgi:hypothetical protein
MRKLVDGLSKPEQRTCAAQGIEVEGTFRDGLKHATPEGTNHIYVHIYVHATPEGTNHIYVHCGLVIRK